MNSRVHSLTNELKKRRRRDLIWLSGLVIVAIGLTVNIEVVEGLYQFTRNHETWELDELFMTFIWISIASFIFIIRRAADTDQLNRELANLAFRDAVTGLPNREMVHHRLGQLISHARRSHEIFGVLLIDLDNFKLVNDNYGHSVGDKLISSVADRIDAQRRDEDTLARMGGDEFVVLLEDLTGPEQTVGIVQRFFLALKPSHRVGDAEVFISSSMGVAFYPQDGNTAEALLRAADAAMYRAKDQGKNQLSFYSEELGQKLTKRLEIEHGLRSAFLNDEFFLVFQPEIDAASGQVIALEALIRWDYRGKLVPPDQFIPVAEEVGFIDAIGEWVLRTACRQGKRWDDVKIAVNVSPNQLAAPDFVAKVRRILEETQFPAERLELEVTEGALIRDPEGTHEKMIELRALGIHLAIDDFGTGYSSLERLREYKIDKLKIDRSFVASALEDDHSGVITRAIISLAANMGMSAVAEGVETADQAEFLRRYACDTLQGYFYSKPLDASAVSGFIASCQKPADDGSGQTADKEISGAEASG
ncbi:MAG: EAL domain-containing protein [Pseudomonadales bacterium]|nr:EAL domain-containing protein [Pseudomonadales bacterium]